LAPCCMPSAFSPSSSRLAMPFPLGSATTLATGGVSAYIDNTGLFVDGRIADLVAQDTIRIFAFAGISANAGFSFPPTQSFLPTDSPHSLSSGTAAFLAAPPVLVRIANERPSL
jgi:hypothetical protein